MQPNPHPRWRNLPAPGEGSHLGQNLLGGGHCILAILPIRERRPKDGHKPIAQEFVDNPMVAIDTLDHRLKECVQIEDYLLWRATLGEGGEVPNIQEHQADIPDFALNL